MFSREGAWPAGANRPVADADTTATRGRSAKSTVGRVGATGDAGQWLAFTAHASLQDVCQAAGCPEVFRRCLGERLGRGSPRAITVEQVLRSPDVAPQWVAALLAVGARVSFVDEAKEEALADFLRPGNPAHGKVAAVRQPPEAPGSVLGEAYLTCAAGDEPAMAAIAVVVLSEGLVQQARIALSGVWREPAQLADSAGLLVGGWLNVSGIRRVTEAVKREVAPLDDARRSAGYRRAMAGMLTYCALDQCWREASGLSEHQNPMSHGGLIHDRPKD